MWRDVLGGLCITTAACTAIKHVGVRAAVAHAVMTVPQMQGGSKMQLQSVEGGCIDAYVLTVSSL
jgi:hypothetical protein